MKIFGSSGSYSPQQVDNLYTVQFEQSESEVFLVSDYTIHCVVTDGTPDTVQGVHVRSIRINGEEVSLSSPILQDGWLEPTEFGRWTNGSGRIVAYGNITTLEIVLAENSPLIPSYEAALLPDYRLALAMESLGDNCEFGIVQRRLRTEPLGLLRFAGMRLPELVRALDEGFAHIEDPSGISLRVFGHEYMVNVSRYNYEYHSGVFVGQMPQNDLLIQQGRKLAYQRRLILEDLRAADKLFVFKQNETVAKKDVLGLLSRLQDHGPCSLLWVTERGESEAGGVVMLRENLLQGTIRRFAPRTNASNPDMNAWLPILRQAYNLWKSELPAPLWTVHT